MLEVKKSEFDTNFKVLVPKYYSALLVPCQVRVLHKHDAALGYAKTDELDWTNIWPKSMPYR